MLAGTLTVEGEADQAEALRARFAGIVAEHAGALQRLARGYEVDAGRQQDLVQEMLVALWRALPAFGGRSSARTWVHRVAHNVAVTHVVRGRRDRLARAVSLDDAEGLPRLVRDAAREAEGREAVHRLAVIVRGLRPADAQIILSYLEGLEHAEIAEVAGISVENVAVKIHRIKAVLRSALEPGGES